MNVNEDQQQSVVAEVIEPTDKVEVTENTVAQTDAVQDEKVEVVAEQPIVIVNLAEPDANEQILAAWWESGKREVSTSDLMAAGFERGMIAPLEIVVGRFKLHRILTLSPYKLDKLVQ